MDKTLPNDHTPIFFFFFFFFFLKFRSMVYSYLKPPFLCVFYHLKKKFNKIVMLIATDLSKVNTRNK